MDWWMQAQAFLKAVISIFAIVNPIGGLPVFVSLTEGMSVPERRKTLRLAGYTSLAIICVMAVAGEFLLTDVFGITPAEFMLGGGLILIAVGVLDIVGKPDSGPRHAPDPSQREDQSIRLAVSPIASPLLAGPGSIVTVMLIVRQHGTLYGLGACLACFIFVILVLNYAHLVYRLMGRVASLAVSRIMEIFIVAIGVNFIYQALKQLFPSLGK